MAKKPKPKKGSKKKSGRKAARKKAPARKKSIKRTAAKIAARAAPAALQIPGLKISGEIGPRFGEILTPAALHFLAALHRKFEATRKQLLARRTDRQHRFDAGELPDFLPETKHIREQGWKVAPLPRDLLDRRVEITGPVDRKMVINALNSGAEVYMADFEDACSPSWENLLDGQINLKDRWAGKIDFVDPLTKKSYKLNDKLAVLLVRPRGWHLLEDHITVDGTSISASTSSTTPSAPSPPAPGLISICRNWRTTTRRGSGTKSSSSRNRSLGCRTAPSRRPC
jgi:hypothetical protein